MNSVHLGKIKTCMFENKLILAFSQEWLKLNDGKPLEFEVEFQKKELVLRASLGSGSLNTDQSERIELTR